MIPPPPPHRREQHAPRSCADTAGRRYSSSRPSLALSTSAGRPARAPYPARAPLVTRHRTAGTAFTSASARTLASAPRTSTSLHRSTSPGYVLPHRRCTRRRSQHSVCSLHHRLTPHREPSNPHSSSPLLIGISTPSRFPPLRIVQRLSVKTVGTRYPRARGQASDTPY